jgi:predicted dehydrogenase
MIEAFQARGVPLWVAYYRRALPRFLAVRDLLDRGAIGRVTAVHVDVRDRLAEGDGWRFDRDIAGGGLFLDLASHAFDLLDFLLGPIADVSGYAVNTGGAYEVEDGTAAAFRFAQDTLGTGSWNFNADEKGDRIVFTGTRGTLTTPIFSDTDVLVESRGARTVHSLRNPSHVHQPLIQTIVDELHGRGTCPSTGDSAARASWVMDECLRGSRGC